MKKHDGLAHRDDNFFLVLAVVGAFLFIGVGVNYLTNLNTNSQKVSQSVQASTQNFTDTTSWISEQIQLKKELPSEEKINVSLQYPRDWTLKIETKSEDSTYIYKGCFEYVITNPENTAELTISPLCVSWFPTYVNLSPGAISVGITNKEVSSMVVYRYFDYSKNQYVYQIPDTLNKVADAMPFTYQKDTGKTVPIQITFKYTGFDTEASLKIADTIVDSISTKLNQDVNGD